MTQPTDTQKFDWLCSTPASRRRSCTREADGWTNIHRRQAGRALPSFTAAGRQRARLADDDTFKHAMTGTARGRRARRLRRGRAPPRVRREGGRRLEPEGPRAGSELRQSSRRCRFAAHRPRSDGVCGRRPPSRQTEPQSRELFTPSSTTRFRRARSLVVVRDASRTSSARRLETGQETPELQGAAQAAADRRWASVARRRLSRSVDGEGRSTSTRASAPNVASSSPCPTRRTTAKAHDDSVGGAPSALPKAPCRVAAIARSTASAKKIDVDAPLLDLLRRRRQGARHQRREADRRRAQRSATSSPTTPRLQGARTRRTRPDEDARLRLREPQGRGSRTSSTADPGLGHA